MLTIALYLFAVVVGVPTALCWLAAFYCFYESLKDLWAEDFVVGLVFGFCALIGTGIALTLLEFAQR